MDTFQKIGGIVFITFCVLLTYAILTQEKVLVQFSSPTSLSDALKFAKAHNADIQHIFYFSLSYSESSTGGIKITHQKNVRKVNFDDSIEPNLIPPKLVQLHQDSNEALRNLASSELQYQSEYVELIHEKYGAGFTLEQILTVRRFSCIPNPDENLEQQKLKLLLRAKRARIEMSLRERVDNQHYLASLKVWKYELHLSLLQEILIRIRTISFSGTVEV